MRHTTLSAATATVPAAAAYGFLKVSFPEAANNHYEKIGSACRVLASGPVERGFGSTRGQVLAIFPLCFSHNPYDFFSFQ